MQEETVFQLHAEVPNTSSLTYNSSQFLTMQHANVTTVDLQLLREEKTEREGKREIF